MRQHKDHTRQSRNQHCQDQQWLSAQSILGKVEEQLKGHSFLRTAVSHLANLRYVDEIDGNTMILTTGDRLPISRSHKKDVMAGLASFLGGTL